MTTLRFERPRFPASVAAVALALVACSAPLKLAKDDSPTVLAHQIISAPNPSDAGPYKVVHMYYGSGNDKRRAVYRDSVTLKTRPVDISPYVTVPPAAADDRKKFWGFDMKKVPLNARVWYPEGAGPFPLVLVVHGNHNPEDFSDPGYGYLGEHLASRGFILASIDENFINGLSGENDGRAWLLLKHLQEWKRWNDSTGSPLYHKVDMDKIALMGHSRGGEAAPLAATFNKLAFYPDDAKQKLEFHFNIRSVVSIAPVDGQYKPAGQFTPLENVNYLVIHGSHDGDVSTFTGLRQFERLRFTDGQPHFKAAIYMYRANHGQWNTVWNNKDNGPRSGRSLDLRALIAPEEQRRFAKLVISAFLEATLNGKREYLPMFRDHRTAGHWFPKTMYITRFQESGYTPLAEYDEDVDVTTGSVPGVTLMGDSLGTWKEATLPVSFPGRRPASQRRLARVEQPHRRQGHDEDGKARVVHGHDLRLTSNGALADRSQRDLSLDGGDEGQAGPARRAEGHDQGRHDAGRKGARQGHRRFGEEGFGREGEGGTEEEGAARHHPDRDHRRAGGLGRPHRADAAEPIWNHTPPARSAHLPARGARRDPVRRRIRTGTADLRDAARGFREGVAGL